MPLDTDGLPDISPRELNRELLRSLVSSFYQIQRVRIQIGNKICQHFNRKLGVSAKEKLTDQSGKSIEMIVYLKREFRRLADAIAYKENIRDKQFNALTKDQRGVFDSVTEFIMLDQYRKILACENKILVEIEKLLQTFPIWTDYLSRIHGMGPTIGSVIVSTIDIHKSPTSSSLFRFAGLDVVVSENDEGDLIGKGRGKFKDHLVKRTYTNRDGKEAERDSITFNPTLKTKLVGVMADCFVKLNTPIYRDDYDNYKFRITNMPEHKEKTKAHIHRMAMRYMVKRFLVNLYKTWRAMEGLEVVEEYAIRKLGLVHHESAPSGLEPLPIEDVVDNEEENF